jgi:hypothetical protein
VRGRGRRGRATAVAVALPAILLGAWVASAVVRADPGAPPPFSDGTRLLPDDVTGAGHVGRAVALSGDGSVALVGAPHDSGEVGAAWVFVREGDAWTQQAKLAVGKTEGSSFFGRAVALSADGSTALVGDPGNATRVGAAWVFTRSGNTWTLQAKLLGTGEVGAGQFGRSVSLSGDGSLALVGAYTDAANAGAVWTFARTAGAWTQQGPKLTGAGEEGGGWFGRGVALSADGTSALVGASNDAHGVGAAWAYGREGAAWVQQGPKLTGAGESGAGQFGESVALSADGSTGLVGAPNDDEEAGAAWVFTRAGSSWSPQGPKLTADDEQPPGLLGYSVSLDEGGSTALAGGYTDDEKVGAAWTFTRAAEGWAQDGGKLTAPGEAEPGRFGFGVALSGDASTALVGALTDEEGVGAAWVFSRVPAGPEPVVPPPPENTSSTNTQTPPMTPGGSGSTTGLVGVLSNTAAVSPPLLAVSGNVEPVSGKVFVRLPHGSFQLLSGLRQIPYGTLVDARTGSVLVTAARQHGGDQSGEFFDGEFVLSQRRDGRVTAILAGGNLTACGARPARVARTGARSASRHKRKLWANAHGTFSTQGNYAVGAVQGTEWLTEDTCTGTLIRVTRDKVRVTDLVHHRSFIVRVGHSVFVHRP